MKKGKLSIDIGARDGYLSKLLVNFFVNVFALDLEEPNIDHKNITCVKGNVTRLDFPENCFDLVFCAEGLEHITDKKLQRACKEITRVAKKKIIIGVPYKQDIRVGRTTCKTCGNTNPPWGHVNTFDETIRKTLFSDLYIERILYVGENRDRSNFLSSTLLDIAGNPYGTYSQEEPCIHCGHKLIPPGKRTVWQKMCTKAAYLLIKFQSLFISPTQNWIHILFSKRA